MNATATLLAATLILASAGAAAAEEKKARRLDSVTWNPSTHKLVWVVTEGKVGTEGGFKGEQKTTYEINMSSATMTLNGEGRRFSKSEAVRVQQLMDIVTQYAAESTVWWEAGEGEPIDENGKPKRPRMDRSRPDTDEPVRKPRRSDPEAEGTIIQIKH
jgi:hypothetical protein